MKTCYLSGDMHDTSPMLAIACDLAADIASADRYRRLIAAVPRIIPCDAAALLRLDGDTLVPVATTGLVPEVAGRRFRLRDQPRLAAIMEAGRVVRFPVDSPLADPFDGSLLGDPTACARMHACMGCPLRVAGEAIGVLALDARDPHAFAGIADDTVATLAALAGAAVRTGGLIEAMEMAKHHQGLVVRQLLLDGRQRAGAQLLGTSAAMERLREEIALVAQSDLSVLITGESGVGKEVVANAIHTASRRSDEPLIHVNCAALPESIAESELFGHLRGSFTGASSDRAGKFELADGGTLFLDEVGELPPLIQPKLLRALQQGEVQRVGSDRSLTVDVRVIAATNRDLSAEMEAGRFRPDLYHRLGAFPLHVPPLRERREDIALLSGHILDQACARFGHGQLRLTPAARSDLEAHAWPGNVRELEHVLMRATLRAAGGWRRQGVVIDTAHLDIQAAAAEPAAEPLAAEVPGETLAQAIDGFTRRRIRDAVERHQGNWSAAGRDLGMSRGNLHRLATRLGLKPLGAKAARA
jgi:anaerobic nitric oxide reductase transcription regulator